MNLTANPDMEKIAEATAEAVNGIRMLEKSGINFAADLLNGREFFEYAHYPPDDPFNPGRRPNTISKRIAKCAIGAIIRPSWILTVGKRNLVH